MASLYSISSVARDEGISEEGRVTDEQTSKTPAFTPHALRGRVLAEVHARPFVPMEGAKRILHFAFTTDPPAAAKAREALEAFCLDRAYPASAPEAKQHRIELLPAILRWEHHGEFMTYSWEFPQDAAKAGSGDAAQLAFRPGAGELSSFMRLLPQPGPLLVAADLHLLPEGPGHDEWRSLFEPSQLAASEVMDGAAIVATDFHPDAFGFVRLLVLDRRLMPSEAGALVHRLLEVETYRTLALLGLPEAEAAGPVIRRIETELPLLVERMREGEGLDASRELLAHLTALAAELEAGAAQSLFRFGATRAYHELVSLRLDALGEIALPEVPTLKGFLTLQAYSGDPDLRRDRGTSGKSFPQACPRCTTLAHTRRDRARKPKQGSFEQDERSFPSAVEIAASRQDRLHRRHYLLSPGHPASHIRRGAQNN